MKKMLCLIRVVDADIVVINRFVRSLKVGRKRNDESIRILVSGSDNYNNNVKLINIMDKIL